MRTVERERKSNRSLKAALITGLLLVLFAAAFVILWFVKVEEVYVEGNQYARPADVRVACFNEENDFRLFTILRKELTGKMRIPGMKKVKIRFLDLQTVIIHVEEEPPFCAVPCAEGYLLLTSDLDILSVYPSNMGITELHGFQVGWRKCFTKPVTDQETELKGLVALLNFTIDQQISFESIYFENGKIHMKTGDITIDFGSGAYMNEKISTYRAQVPYLEGLKGTLHLDEYQLNNENEKYYFEVEQ